MNHELVRQAEKFSFVHSSFANHPEPLFSQSVPIPNLNVRHMVRFSRDAFLIKLDVVLFFLSSLDVKL